MVQEAVGGGSEGGGEGGSSRPLCRRSQRPCHCADGLSGPARVEGTRVEGTGTPRATTLKLQVATRRVNLNRHSRAVKFEMLILRTDAG